MFLVTTANSGQRENDDHDEDEDVLRGRVGCGGGGLVVVFRSIKANFLHCCKT